MKSRWLLYLDDVLSKNSIAKLEYPVSILYFSFFQVYVVVCSMSNTDTCFLPSFQRRILMSIGSFSYMEIGDKTDYVVLLKQKGEK